MEKGKKKELKKMKAKYICRSCERKAPKEKYLCKPSKLN